MTDHADSSSRPLPDIVSGRYRIVSRLGVGGMGVVYKALDTQLNRPVAIKALEDRRLLLAGSADRLRQEALAAASLDQPYICKVYELIESDRETFIVMEFVEGETLSSILKRGALPLAQTLQIGREIAEGLANAHARGLVHRDVKPSNVMVTPGGHVKLLDFGVAGLDIESTPGDQTRTIVPQATVHAGTPHYMAPEQAAGQPVTTRADLFSLGVLLYECLTGRLPFAGSTTFDYVRNMMQSAPRRLDRVAPDMPADLVDLVERCLEKSPAERPESASAVVKELQRLTDSLTSTGATLRTARQARAARGWKFAAAGALVIALAAAGWQWFKPAATAPIRQSRPFVTSAALESGSRISPDGQWVSFIATTGRTARVLVQQIDGGEARPLTLGDGTPISQVWSPDGRQLACAFRMRDGQVLQIFPAFFGGASEQTVPLPAPLSNVRLLRWIGRSIYFEAQDAKGVSLRRLDLDRQEEPVALSAAWTLAGLLRSVDVRPDGRAAVLGISVEGREDLWTIDLDGTSARSLMTDAFFDRQPRWNGRGDRVIFQSNRGGQIDLWEIDPRTSALTQLTSGGGEKTMESSSVDATTIAFRQSSLETRLWIWTAGTPGLQLTQDALSDYSPSLAASGALVAFQRSQPTPSTGHTLFDAKIFVAPFAANRAITEGRAIADGFLPRVSADGTWLAYLQRGDRAPLMRLFVRELATGTTHALSPTAAPPLLSLLPADWASVPMTWSPTARDLYYVDHADVDAIKRYRVGEPPADRAWSTSPNKGTYLRDPYLTADGKTLGFLSISADTAMVRAIDVASGEERTLAQFTGAFLSGLFGRGWVNDGFVLLRRLALNEDRTTDLEVVVVGERGQTRTIGRITDAYQHTAQLDRARRVLYITRQDGNAHNAYEFALDGGALTPLTRNALPGVTFSGFVPIGGGAVLGVREERREDLWLIQQSPTTRTGNPAGR